MTVIHACCVSIDDIGVLIRGPSGAGKSDLTLRLIDEGAQFVADDYCDVAKTGDVLVARPPEPIAGKLEVRGYGIIGLPNLKSATISLVVELTDEDNIERLPEEQTCLIEGIAVARAWIDPKSPSAAARVRVIASTLAPDATQQARLA